ncbi:hypothetical protein [Phormidium sp. CCY1219]|uniref:hypothetical protein n=1 Tax=Phormidium sp. CCY1219 TaxID=2886104 RepID=UPI002D1EC409|nr:hypothetical protein [Phormidium sp. CCY1219]MEB3826589.1 hypothetical protein [Phormidium sp. CCY1219]
MLISPLTESLDVLLPNLMPVLVGSDAVLALKSLAGNLAPILRGGFECRLNANAPQVDLQQCIVREERELALLREFVAAAIANKGISVDSGWGKLQVFLDEWQSSLQGIPEIWLEFDVKSCSNFLPLPAIFFGLPQEVSPAVSTYPIAQKSLDLLLGKAGWREWQDNLDRCFSACPESVFVSHIGAMLSRNFPALRVNVKRLQPDGLIPYLQAVGWPGETTELEALMKELFALCDRITVCLDVGNKIYPQIGLECIFLKQPPSEPRWSILLDYLVELGLCERKKGEALLNWPGQTHPMNSQAVWPRKLIAASLLQPRERFTVFDRRLSHIKISWRSPCNLEAKAYLWFEHQWLSVK